jgi:hypothetical protein
MAYPKRVNALNVSHQEKAILEHAGFVRFVSGKINKIGIENVLVVEGNEKFAWLRRAYDRVLDFAESVQLKRMDKPLVDQSTHHHITLIAPPERINELKDRAAAVPV